MSGFSPEWLALREPVDHRSRDGALTARLAAHLAGSGAVHVVDLGCGAGSNIRATSPVLGAEQHWTLVDYDPRLIAAARRTLAAWADRAATQGDDLLLEHGGRRLRVAFRQADLVRDLEAVLEAPSHLVTASALFDLCSAPFLRRLAATVSARRAAFYTVLTYDGRQSWAPAHAADAAMIAAFHRHQATDKGFGPAAGPEAPAVLAAAFRDEGYAVEEGDSPWRLGAGDSRLVGDLVDGYADAVVETGALPLARIADWRALPRTAAVVGHVDTLAMPPRCP